MNKTIYENNKYCIQDVSTLYIGCKYSFGELIADPEVNFKFKAVCERFILQDSSVDDTLETFLYYLDNSMFSLQVLQQIKAKCRIQIIREKKHLFGKAKKEYVTELISVKDLSAMTKEQKEACGVVIQELSVSKLALMAF